MTQPSSTALLFNGQNEPMPWRLTFWANVPDTPLSAPYSYGPYESEIDAKIDAQLLSGVDRIEITQHPREAFAWSAYPPRSKFGG